MRFICVVTLFLMCSSAVATAQADPWIQGSLSIVDATGKRIYGDHLPVFLTAGPIDVPRSPGLDRVDGYQRLDKINQMHLDFYKQFARHSQTPGYLVAQTVSSDTGNFAFLGVPPGDYYVLVLFPAMIAGYKVAWQQPAVMREGRCFHITLDRRNLAIPTARRDDIR